MRNPKLRVLIVESNTDYREYLQELLKSKLAPQIETLACAHGVAALAAIPRFRPELAIVAGEAQGGCGAGLTREIHKLSSAIDVVLMVDEDARKFRGCGAVHVILKTEASVKLIALLKSQNWGHAIGRRMRTVFRPKRSLKAI